MDNRHVDTAVLLVKHWGRRGIDMWPFGPKETKEARFWRWFCEQENALYDFRQNQERVFGQLTRELKRVHPGLTFALSAEHEGPREFVVSADGNRELFPAVRTLVGAAPELPRWKIVAFRPPGDAEVKLQFGEIELDGSEILAAVEPDGDRLGVTLYLPGYHETPDHVYESAAFILLDHALGEYTVETRIGKIAFSAPTAAAGSLVRFSELARLVNADSA